MSTVLIINDEPVQLHLLAGLLEQEQYEVIRFICSEDAWRWLQDGHRPDVIVLDLHMPGISGWRFCEMLHSQAMPGTSVPPVLAISATYTGVDAQDILRDLGASAFIPLPAEPMYFRQQVRRLLESPPQPQCPHVWMVSSNEAAIQRIQHVFADRGWQVMGWRSGEQIQAATNLVSPNIVMIDEPLADMTSEELAIWCKQRFPSLMCIVLCPDYLERKVPSRVSRVDAYIPQGYDPLNLLSLCEKGRWERALSRVEHLLDIRTDDLRESEAQFEALFETLPDILVIYDHQDVMTHINVVGARQLGFSTDELRRKPLSLIYSHGTKEHKSPIRDEGNGYVSEWKETLFRHHNGTDLSVEIMEQGVRFQGQRQILLIARDLTTRRHMEQEKTRLECQLRQVQKMEAIGRLASGVAHDMNNILTAIMAHANLVKVGAEADNRSWIAGDVIEKAVRRGKELTSQLLGFARQGKHHHVAVDIHDVIQEVVGLLGRTINKTISVRSELFAETPCVIGDPSQIYQILMNLAVNACDAMGDSGKLVLQTSNECVTPEQASHVPGLYAGEYVLIRVTDSGTGIPADIQGQIFEPFFTTKEQGEGTGMGLAMVYGIVKNHRGYIGVTSMLGGGTTMRVYLPSTSGSAAKSHLAPEKEAQPGTGHILVVDDEKDVAEAAQAILEYLGYRVTVALNGKEAVRVLNNSDIQLDVVLLDMVMPDMSGAECFTHLRAIQPAIKVILCTGYDRNHAVQDLLDEGVSGFIQKPYDLDELGRICARVIKSETGIETSLTGVRS